LVIRATSVAGSSSGVVVASSASSSAASAAAEVAASLGRLVVRLLVVASLHASHVLLVVFVHFGSKRGKERRTTYWMY